MAYEREDPVEDHLVKEAKREGLEIRKLKWIGRRGAPDRLLLLEGGEAVFVETKAPKGPTRSGQLREHARLRALGFRVEVIFTKEQVDEFMRSLWHGR